jgi:hypothetical protein
MKKEMILTIFACWAAITFSNGQAMPGSSPRPLTGCSDDALHPVAGKPYTYKVSATPAGGQFYWWATNDPSFIRTDESGNTTNNLATHLKSPTTAEAGTDLTLTSDNYAKGSETDEVTITWSSSILANTVYNSNPTFVAVYYQGNDCADNLKVFQLDPKTGFTVDIRNIDGINVLDFDAVADQCVDQVRSATFSGTMIEYDYGKNYFYYEVIAANFSEEWTPQFELTGLHSAQTSTIEWTYSTPATWSASTVWNSDGSKVITNETNTSQGVSIYIRVTVNNNNYEGLASRDLTLAVAGMNKEGQWDVANEGCSIPNGFDTAKADDQAIQKLLPRPTMPSGTTSSISPNIELIGGNSEN